MVHVFHTFHQILSGSLFNGDWITSVSAYTSDRERSTRTSFTLIACPNLLPKRATKSPKKATKSLVSGYKVAVFGNKCGQAFMNNPYWYTYQCECSLLRTGNIYGLTPRLWPGPLPTTTTSKSRSPLWRDIVFITRTKTALPPPRLRTEVSIIWTLCPVFTKGMNKDNKGIGRITYRLQHSLQWIMRV